MAEEYLIEADESMLPLQLSAILSETSGTMWSEMDGSIFVGRVIKLIFVMWDTYSRDRFRNNVLFNYVGRTGDSIFGTTIESLRPDTLVTASVCTFLVGEDKFSSLSAAEEDVRKKIQSLPSMFYGDVECILCYVVARTGFQWLCIHKSGEVKKAGRSLNLVNYSDRCKFLLSIGYAYQLIKKMDDSVPDVPGRRAMFTHETVGMREIAFYPDYIQKTIKDFSNFCGARRTQLEWIEKAYNLGEKCGSLPRMLPVGVEPVHLNTYRVKIRPIGFPPMLRTEQDSRMLAKNVCEALFVLHEAGLVHRDIRLPNILQVSKDHFMLIDLETVTESPFILPAGFETFYEWSDVMLEGNCYTPLSDMYQLGKLLECQVRPSSESAYEFIRKLLAKQYSAKIALRDPWVSNLTS